MGREVVEVIFPSNPLTREPQRALFVRCAQSYRVVWYYKVLVQILGQFAKVYTRSYARNLPVRACHFV